MLERGTKIEELEQALTPYLKSSRFIEAVRKVLSNKGIVVTIDGPSGSGKSTVAKQIAKKLGAEYFSYSIVWRLITAIALEKKIPLEKVVTEEALASLVDITRSLDLVSFGSKQVSGRLRYLYRGKDITDMLYTDDVEKNVAFVAQLPEIRAIAVRQVRSRIYDARVKGTNWVLEGRVTGTELVPDADAKIYLTATLDERARRRAIQKIRKAKVQDPRAQEEIIAEVKNAIAARDALDSHREHMPAQKPEGAVDIDTTTHTVDETVAKIWQVMEETIPSKDTISIIKKIHREAIQLFSRVKNYLKDEKRKDTPIDIVVDLSLMDEKDLDANIETWAYLILLCRDMENVNFVFKNLEGSANPRALGSQIKLLADLRQKIIEKSIFITGFEGTGELVERRIRSDTSAIESGEKPIEILIASKEFLEALAARKTELRDNQYPVALEGETDLASGESTLKNFEGALAIGLTEASLVIAQRKNESLPEVKRLFINRLQRLYSAALSKDITLTMDTLDNMIHSSSNVRVDLAISLALPSMPKMPIESLKRVHEELHLALQSA